MTNVNVLQFNDYRAFLKAHAQAQKEKNPQWSLGAWAKRMSLGGTAVLTNILNGKKETGPALEHKFVQFFQFSREQENYFRDLVALARAKKDPLLWGAMVEKIRRAYKRPQFEPMDEKVFQLMAQPLYGTLLEMVSLNDFQNNPSWIKARLRIPTTLKEIERALNDLLVLKLIEVKGNTFKRNENFGMIRSSHDVVKPALQLYHTKMLGIAKDLLTQVPILERDYVARSFNIKRKDIEKLKERLASFREEIARDFEAELMQGEEVYELCMQFFPLTQKLKPKIK